MIKREKQSVGNGHLALDTLLPEERLIAKDSFKINMSDKDAPNLNSIINLYRLELDVPFALQQFDSLLAITFGRTNVYYASGGFRRFHLPVECGTETARYIVQSIYRSNVSL